MRRGGADGRDPGAGGGEARHGVARVLAKLGYCSRAAAQGLVRAGRVQVNGEIVRDAEFPTSAGRDAIRVDDAPVVAGARHYLMLNKPRGLVTTAADERGRDTVYSCFEGAGLPWIAPVGRLDRASEGLLLFTNDTGWAARITAPDACVEKTYHVQVDGIPDESALQALRAGIEEDGEHLRALRAGVLRAGARNAWLEIVIDEGRNRHIRRLLAAQDLGVLRLVRVAIGGLGLGTMPKGGWRPLTDIEIASFSHPPQSPRRRV